MNYRSCYKCEFLEVRSDELPEDRRNGLYCRKRNKPIYFDNFLCKHFERESKRKDENNG